MSMTEETPNSPPAPATGEGPPPTDAPLAEEAPVVEGTGAGDALKGVRIDDEDAAHAVDPEDGSGGRGTS